MPNLYALLLLLSFFICLGVGCFVFFSSSRKAIHATFLTLCLFNAYLAFCEFQMNQAADLQTAEFWLRVYSFWVVVVAACFHFILIFTGRGRYFRRWWVWAVVYGPLLAIPLAGLFVEPEVPVSSLVKQPWGYSTVSSASNPFVAFFFLLVVAYGYASSIIAFVYYLRQKNPRMKKQAAYVALGCIIPSIMSVISGAFPAMTGRVIPDITVFGAAIQEILIGLAIWRFDLFELSPAMAANKIIATMSDMLIITDARDRITAINGAITRNLGYVEADLLATPVHNILKIEVSEALWTHSRTSGPLRAGDASVAIGPGQFRGALIAGNGRTIPAEIVVSTLTERSGQTAGHVIISRDITERMRAEEEKNLLIASLQDALANIKTLKGMIPICSSCKKVRNDAGSWQMVEEYISAHTEADFSHGICEDCFRKLYPDFPFVSN
jgi:PAS domain S-box-containing protein